MPALGLLAAACIASGPALGPLERLAVATLAGLLMAVATLACLLPTLGYPLKATLAGPFLPTLGWALFAIAT